MNKDNIDLQTAVIEAKTKLAEIDERITGQRSEQLTNLNSLEREREAQNKEAAEKRKEQLEKEAELMQELIDLQNEDIRVKKKANKSLTEQIDSATEANEEQVKALKKKMEEELAWLKQQKKSSEENLKLQNEEIKKQEEELEMNEKIVQKNKESEKELVENAAWAAKTKLFQFNRVTELMSESEQKRLRDLKNMNVESAEDLAAFTAEYQEVLADITDAGYKHTANNFMDFGAAVKEQTTEVGADLVGMEGEIQRTLANNSEDAIENSQAIINMSQASADESLNFINNYANAEAEIRERYGQQILDTEASLTDTTTELKTQASDDLFLHFETAQQKEIRLAEEKYDDLLGLAENDAEATAKLEKEKTDILEAINQKYIDEEEKKKQSFYKFTESIETDARQKELDDLKTHLDQILALEGLTEEERILALEEFNNRKDEINSKFDEEEIEKGKEKQRELQDMALQGMHLAVKIASEGARKEIIELEKKFKNIEFARKEVTLTTDLQGFSKGLNDVFNKAPWAKPFFLFARTGVNGLVLTAKHTPGFNFLVKEFNDIARATPDNLADVAQYGINTADDLINAKALQKGRLIVGGSVISMAGMHFLNGGLTGNGPTDRQKRRVWLDAGWQPRSINIGGVWVGYDSFEPFNQILSAVADIGDHSQLMGEEWTQDQFQKLSLVIMEAVTSKSYLQGLQQFVDLLSGEPGQHEKIIGGLMNNSMPLAGLRNEIGKLFNPHMKELNKSWTDSIRNRNLLFEYGPGANLPTKYDMLNGQPVRDYDFMTRMWNMFIPVSLNLDQGPGRKLLLDSGYDLRMSTYYGADGTDLSNSPQLRSEFQRLIGKQNLELKLNKLARDPRVQESIRAMNYDLNSGRRELDPMKSYLHNKLIRRLFDKARKKAWAEMMQNSEVQRLIEQENELKALQNRRLKQTREAESVLQLQNK